MKRNNVTTLTWATNEQKDQKKAVILLISHKTIKSSRKELKYTLSIIDSSGKNLKSSIFLRKMQEIES